MRHRGLFFATVLFFALNVTAICWGQSFVTGDRLSLGLETNRSASARLGDVDGDGDLDVVVANGRHWPQQNYVFFNRGTGVFSVARPLGTDLATTYACELADLDGDGDLDIVTGNDMALGNVFLNDGSGRFQHHSTYGEVSSVRSLTLADIDADGDVDIVVTSRGRQNRMYLNDGKASFSDGPTFGSKADSTIDVAVCDVNQDGQQDLILANRDGQQSCLLLNDGKQGFEPRRPFGKRGVDSRSVAAADIDGDGNLDWVTGNIGHANTIYFGDGKGGTTKQVDFGADDARTYTLALADIDNDGDIDVVTGNVGQRNAVFFNQDGCLLYTSPSPRDRTRSRMPSSA